MDMKETLALLYLARSLYPRDKSLDRSREELSNIAKAWTELLEDVPFDVGRAALAVHAAGSPYAPAISEIRGYARRMTEPEPLSAEEAWALAQKTIRRYGTAPYKDLATGKYPHELARENTPPEVWRVMELLGYSSMCLSENTDALRGQFIRAWERQQKLRAERENMAPFLPECLKDRVRAIGAATSSALGDASRS